MQSMAPTTTALACTEPCAVTGEPPCVDVTETETFHMPADGSVTVLAPVDVVEPEPNVAVQLLEHDAGVADHANVAPVPPEHETLSGSDVPTVAGPAGASVQENCGVLPHWIEKTAEFNPCPTPLLALTMWSMLIGDDEVALQVCDCVPLVQVPEGAVQT